MSKLKLIEASDTMDSSGPVVSLPMNDINADESFLFDPNQTRTHILNHSFNMDVVSSDFFKNRFSEIDPVIISLYAPVFLMALFANTMVIVIVFKYNYMRSVTNFFLVNLSIADLLVTLVCMPMAIMQSITKIWFQGIILCKLTRYLQCVAVSTSVFTITTMSVDRYLAITQPIGFQRLLNRRSAKLVIFILWCMSFSIFAPLLLVVSTRNIDIPSQLFVNTSDGAMSAHQHNTTMPPMADIVLCVEDWGSQYNMQRHIFGYFWFVLVYAIPGSIMVVAYSLMGRTLCSVKPPFDSDEGVSSTQQRYRLVRERKRVAWILLLLAVLFALCWLPYNIMTLLIDTATADNEIINTLLPYALLLGHTNSAINPILYCFMTKNFRRSVKELIFKTRNNWSSSRKHMQRGQIRLVPYKRNVNNSNYSINNMVPNTLHCARWAPAAQEDQRTTEQQHVTRHDGYYTAGNSNSSTTTTSTSGYGSWPAITMTGTKNKRVNCQQKQPIQTRLLAHKKKQTQASERRTSSQNIGLSENSRAPIRQISREKDVTKRHNPLLSQFNCYYYSNGQFVQNQHCCNYCNSRRYLASSDTTL